MHLDVNVPFAYALLDKQDGRHTEDLRAMRPAGCSAFTLLPADA